MSDVYQSKQTEKENMRKQKYKILMKKYLGLLKNDVTQNYVLCEPLRLSISRSHKISILTHLHHDSQIVNYGWRRKNIVMI